MRPYQLKILQVVLSLGLIFVYGESQSIAAPRASQSPCIGLILAQVQASNARGEINYFQSTLPADPNDTDGFVVSTKDVPLSVGAVIEAYSNGMFPWNPEAEGTIGWYSPAEHGVIDLEALHNRKGRGYRHMRNAFNLGQREGWVVTFNRAHAAVVQGCAENERDQSKYGHVWLTQEMQDFYNYLHSIGVSHSVEVWDRNGDLIGGTYGPYINGMFSPESMFNHNFRTKEKVKDAGKFGIISVADFLYETGHKYMDSQTVNENTRHNYRAIGMPREKYIEVLREIQANYMSNYQSILRSGQLSPFSRNPGRPIVLPGQ